MKKVFISAVIFILVAFTGKEPNIIGRWETTQNGEDWQYLFKKDSTFEGYYNGEMIVKGKYTFKDSALSFSDDADVQGNPICEAAGSYKAIITRDSVMRCSTIKDDCIRRRMSTEGRVFTRIKE